MSFVGSCQQEHRGVFIGNEVSTTNSKWKNIDYFERMSGAPYDIFVKADGEGGYATKISSAQ